jgi:hypothetical protein
LGPPLSGLNLCHAFRASTRFLLLYMYRSAWQRGAQVDVHTCTMSRKLACTRARGHVTVVDSCIEEDQTETRSGAKLQSEKAHIRQEGELPLTVRRGYRLLAHWARSGSGMLLLTSIVRRGKPAFAHFLLPSLLACWHVRCRRARNRKGLRKGQARWQWESWRDNIVCARMHAP